MSVRSRVYRDKRLSIGLPPAIAISDLWRNGEQGIWIDSGDISTMFQDPEGTIPSYTPGLGVVDPLIAKILDKSGRGNHATQSNFSCRPTLSGRYNMLTHTEDFGGAAWLRTECSVSINMGLGPSGRQVEKIIPSTNVAAHSITQSVTSGTEARIARIVIKADGCDKVSMYPGSSNTFVNFNLTAGTYTVDSGVTSASMQALGDGWYECSAIWPVGPALATFRIYTSSGTIGASGVAGDGVSGLLIDTLDIRALNDGVGLPNYQKVLDASNYNTEGFPLYLKFDGIDDYLQTASINFSTTDKMLVSAAVRKMTDTNVSVIVELSASSAANNGTFTLYAPPDALQATYGFVSKGTSSSTAYVSDVTAPVTSVLVSRLSISGNSVACRANGLSNGESASNQGTGNYGNYPLYIGRRAGTSASFNGRIYSIVIRGAYTNTQTVARIERSLNEDVKVF